MSLINVSNLTFAYDGSYDNIFENASFQLDTDWRLGFTGRNGRGKTTFLNLLMGKYEYSGNISASVEFTYFPYPVPDKDRMGCEIVEEIYPDYEYWQIARELHALELDDEILYRPYGTLSNGEQTKLLLAVLFLKENNFLLIDEPTNHLDLHGRQIVSRYLNSKKGFILVSHDRAFLDGCVDHILSINRSTIEVRKGNFSTWYHNKQLQDHFELAENEKLKKEIQHLTDSMREKAAWSDRAEARKIGIDPTKVDNKKGYRPLQGAKAKKAMARSKAIEQRQQAAIEEKSALLKDLDQTHDLKIFQTQFHSDRLLELREVAIDYGGGPVCENISFQLRRGDRVALQGPNGSGKSSLLKLILGQDIPHTGSLWMGKELKISYVSQDASDLRGSLADYALEQGLDEALFKAMLQKLGFQREQFAKDIANFSAGQKKKVLIAQSIIEPAHLHIWDEPMNYIDVISRMQIEQLLLQFRPTLLFVEHDKMFCEKIATQTVIL